MEDQQQHLQQQLEYEAVVTGTGFGLGAPTPYFRPSSMQQMPAEISFARNPNSAHYDMLMMAHHTAYQQQLLQDSNRHQHHEMMLHNSSNNNTGSSTSGGLFATEINNCSEANVCGDGGGGGARWPRQETLTLLEIRSRLDHKFKEANQKGPLWDEISRIMSDEHGYQRSGKKCREKFENLYKYYKKTKEGKAGRQDGKHYRFFRQLEALYGESKPHNPVSPLQEASRHFSPQIGHFDHLKKNNNTPSCSNHMNSLRLGNHSGYQNFDSLSYSSDFNTSSSEDDSEMNGIAVGVHENGSSENKGRSKKRRGRRNWRAKIKEFIDSQMRSLVEIQEVWLAKVMKTIEQNEQARVLREEEWKRKEEERMDRERKFWASERQWIEAREAGLMEALCKANGGRELVLDTFNNNHDVMPRDDHRNENSHNIQWGESEITRLVQVRASMEPKFKQVSGECNWGQEFVLWEEIAASLGSNKSSSMCKNKWESINSYDLVSRNKNDFASKKQKGDSSSRSSSGCCYGASENGQVEGIPVLRRLGFEQTHDYNNNSMNNSSNLNTANNNNNTQQQTDQSFFFRFLMVDQEGGSENIWGSNNRHL